MRDMLDVKKKKNVLVICVEVTSRTLLRSSTEENWRAINDDDAIEIVESTSVKLEKPTAVLNDELRILIEHRVRVPVAVIPKLDDMVELETSSMLSSRSPTETLMENGATK